MYIYIPHVTTNSLGPKIIYEYIIRFYEYLISYSFCYFLNCLQLELVSILQHSSVVVELSHSYIICVLSLHLSTSKLSKNGRCQGQSNQQRTLGFFTSQQNRTAKALSCKYSLSLPPPTQLASSFLFKGPGRKREFHFVARLHI